MGKKKKRKKKNKLPDIILAGRGKSREQEIEDHGKSTIFKTKVIPPKTRYNRKEQKKIIPEE